LYVNIKKGSGGTHNGMRSIVKCLGTTDFPRVRVGVSKPEPGRDLANFVLSRFSKDEEVDLKDGFDKAIKAIDCIIREDIDMKGSYISKRFPIIYKLFGKRFKHRGFTHSLLFIGVIAFLGDMVIVSSDNNVVFTCIFSGILAGVISHIILDLITKEGVELFYPISINFSILPIKTSSKTEKNINKFLSLLVIFLIGYRFYLITL
jgi:inner membrane protein